MTTNTAEHNGHHLEPFTLSGPVSGWPQRPVPDGRGQDGTAADKPRWWRHAVSERRAWLAAVPVILVNVVAFGAQLGFWHAHVRNIAGAALVALALESIAIYLAWHAHLAQLADDSALRLRLAAYGMALLIGALNYSHYMASGWRPTVEAVTFGMMSAISPWLWSVHSRRISRDALKASRDIEPHGVRLGMTRWTWHPVRSCRVMFRATWLGVTKPAAAIALLDGEDVQPHEDKQVDKQVDKEVDRRVDKPRTAMDKAAAALRRRPDWTDTQLAKAAGVSTKTIQRARKETLTG